MRKSLSIVLSTLLVLMGLVLMVASFWNKTLSADKYRYLVLYGQGIFFLLLLLLIPLFRPFAVEEYRKVMTVMLFLLAVGMLMNFIFFGFMWMVVSQATMAVFIAVFPKLYGLTLILAGSQNYFLCQDEWRPYLYEFYRQLPYAYYRYRT